MKRLALFSLLVVAGLALAGCGSGYYGGPGYYGGGGYYNRSYIYEAPPPPRYERYGYAPQPGYVWQPGYYSYRGRGYDWVPGTWAQPPRPRARWMPGEWRHASRGYYWRNGYWR